MIWGRFCFVLFMCCFFSTYALEEEPKANTTPQALQSSAQSAEKWLQLLDRQKYAESWESGSLTLRLTFPRQAWISFMEKVRKPYGSFISRTRLLERPAKDPANLPKGDYMVIVFGTAFSRQPKVNELVTLIQESDGQWRVLTYTASTQH